MNESRRVTVIINPATGQGNVNRLKHRLTKKASRAGVEVDFFVTEFPGHATEIARDCCERDVDIVVAVGGDGTVSEVVTGVLGTDLVVGIVPIGSTNMIAKELGVPRRLSAAMDVALGNGTPKTFDVGRVRDTTFMHLAGAGYDGQIMHETSGKWKRRIGWPAYLWPATKHLRSKLFRAEIEIDGEAFSMDARMVLCAIGGSIVHPRFIVGQGIDRHDGLIDVCVYNPPNALTAITSLGWILLRKPERSRWQQQFKGKSIVLRSDPPVEFEADGTPLGELPVVIQILETPARILTPG
jgi:diacylglycerol kinase (ATP)